MSKPLVGVSEVLLGDCVELMAAMPEASVDAIVTDPPYGLGFMGKAWDDLPPGREWATECLRVLKPGGHMLAFGGTRTYHRLACAVEDAGFEIRDTVCWLYGSGFPKSLDVGKAIDKAAGVERQVVGLKPSNGPNHHGRRPDGYGGGARAPATDTLPSSPDAARWDGWGTALKPAHEPVVVARKPLAGTVATNVLEHGTGALNVDGCRVEHVTVNGGNLAENPHLRESIKNTGSTFGADGELVQNPTGRWPANVVLDEDAAAMLDEQTAGTRADKPSATGTGFAATGHFPIENHDPASYADRGGASRFFYCAKASRSERGTDNRHPTVKPLKLMCWLVRLVTPPGGVVLDPFAGSGTTGIAAQREGFQFIGLDREPEYVELARERIRRDNPLANGLAA